MNSQHRKVSRALGRLFALSCVGLYPLNVVAQAETAVAIVDGVEGIVEIQRSGQGAFVTATTGTKLFSLDVVRTGGESRASLSFVSGGLVRLAETSELQVKTPGILRVPEGKVYYFGREITGAPNIETQNATTAIRGTEFVLISGKERTEVSVLDGAVISENQQGIVEARRGERILVNARQAPVKDLLVQPMNAVQWCLHVPFLLTIDDMRPYYEAHATVRKEFEDIRNGDLRGVQTSYRKNLSRDYNSVEAAMLAAATLSRGDVGTAQSIIDEQLRRSNASDLRPVFVSLHAMLYLGTNQWAAAADAMKEIPANAYHLPVVAFVRSLIAQSRFDLAGAEAALTPAPPVPYLRVRLAELAMGQQQYSRAHSLVRAAIREDSEYYKSYEVDGFLRLIDKDISGAERSFRRTLVLAPEDGPAYLGLALVYAHRGDLLQAQRMVEHAVFLAPTVAVYRSYLGKLFFEQNKFERAGGEYGNAIAMDSSDPTAYLYRAYNNLAENRVIPALQDLERARERGPNQGLFRSSLLLDQDAAVQGAGLAEIFSALGFSRAAEIEAIRALSKDYGNVGAHRLLADSVGVTLQGADVRQTEMLVADGLSPLTLNLFGRAQTTPSINEYSSLLIRPQTRTYVTTQVQSQNSTALADVVSTTTTDYGGISLQATGQASGGSKNNDYGRLYASRILGSWESHAEHRVTFGAETGYDRQRQSQALFDGVQGRSYALYGIDKLRLTPADTLLTYVARGRELNRFSSEQYPRPGTFIDRQADSVQTVDDDLLLRTKTREKVASTTLALQESHQGTGWSVILGAETKRFAPLRSESSVVQQDSTGILAGLDYPLITRGKNTLAQQSYYGYGQIQLASWATLTTGISYNASGLEDRSIPPFVSGRSRRSGVLPKFGLVVTPSNTLTLRAAYVEGLNRSLLENERTLEPTLVGGFVQRYTDLPGTRSRSVGIGADYRKPGSLYAGAELVQRFLNNQLQAPNDTQFILDRAKGELTNQYILGNPTDGHAVMKRYRGYLYVVLTESTTATIDYLHGLYRDTDADLRSRYSLDRVAISLRGFNTLRVSPYLTSVYRHQRTLSLSDYNLTPAFWTTDVGVSYRFMGRRGSVSLAIVNLFDKRFEIDQSVGFESGILPRIGGACSLSFNF